MKGNIKHFLEDSLQKVLMTLEEWKDFCNIKLKPWKKLIQLHYTTSVHQKTSLKNEKLNYNTGAIKKSVTGK